ncbi:MAG: AI-2E family transporter [Chitinophagales bacterium]
MEIENKNLTTIRNILVFFAAIVTLYIFSLLQDLLVPLVLALFLALLVHPILSWFDKKKIPMYASVGIIVICIICVNALLILIFYKTGKHIFAEKTYFVAQIKYKLGGLLEIYTNITGEVLDLNDAVDKLQNYFSSDFLVNKSGSIFGQLGLLTEEFLLTTVYLILLLTGIMKYENYLHYLGGDIEVGGRYIKAFEDVKSSIVGYVKVKFIISFFYGLVTLILCYIFHLRFFYFWGFLAFILNFLPVVGAMISLIPIALMALIQFDTVGAVFLLIVLVYGLHFILATGLEPIFMGQQTSLNTIVVIMGLLFWGFLWGIFGMFLSVPLMVLTKVILSQITGTEVIVKLLGGEKKK